MDIPERFHFEVIDPRGCRVVCTSDCWCNHILDEHPEMKGREDPVKAAIEKPNPLIIYQDRDFPNRHIYYSIWASRPRYIKVVVEFVDNQNGEVITAFMSDNPKAGEHILWTR